MEEQAEKDRGPREIGDRDILDWPARPVVLLLGCLLLGGGLLLGAYLSGILWSPVFPRDSAFGIAMGSILALPGLALILLAVYAGLTERIFGKTQVEVTPRKVRIGEELTVTVSFDPNFWGRIGGAFATIKAVQEDEVGVRRWREKRVRYEKLRALSRATEVVPGDRLQWSRTFEIPRGSPVTFRSARTSVDWSVGVRVSIPWWPDWRRRKSIVVLPHRGS